jgi:hypothetical protein
MQFVLSFKNNRDANRKLRNHHAKAQRFSRKDAKSLCKNASIYFAPWIKSFASLRETLYMKLFAPLRDDFA